MTFGFGYVGAKKIKFGFAIIFFFELGFANFNIDKYEE